MSIEGVNKMAVWLCETSKYVCMFVQVAFAAPEAATGLKLIDAGVPKDKLALIAVPLVPLLILTPLVLRFD